VSTSTSAARRRPLTAGRFFSDRPCAAQPFADRAAIYFGILFIDLLHWRIRYIVHPFLQPTTYQFENKTDTRNVFGNQMGTVQPKKPGSFESNTYAGSAPFPRGGGGGVDDRATGPGFGSKNPGSDFPIRPPLPGHRLPLSSLSTSATTAKSDGYKTVQGKNHVISRERLSHALPRRLTAPQTSGATSRACREKSQWCPSRSSAAY